MVFIDNKCFKALIKRLSFQLIPEIKDLVIPLINDQINGSSEQSMASTSKHFFSNISSDDKPMTDKSSDTQTEDSTPSDFVINTLVKDAVYSGLSMALYRSASFPCPSTRVASSSG